MGAKLKFVESVAGIMVAALMGACSLVAAPVRQRRHHHHLKLRLHRRLHRRLAPPAKEKLVLRGVNFDFAKYNIRPGDAAVLDEAAATLKANPGVTVDVNGYTDAIGSVEYNQKLSERRAASVVRYLVKAGISEDRLVPKGFGKTDFVATNDTAEGRAQNRRVELIPVQ